MDNVGFAFYYLTAIYARDAMIFHDRRSQFTTRFTTNEVQNIEFSSSSTFQWKV